MIVRNQGEKWLARLDEQDQLPGLHYLVPHGGKEIDLVLGPVSGVVEVGQGKGGGAVAKSRRPAKLHQVFRFVWHRPGIPARR